MKIEEIGKAFGRKLIHSENIFVRVALRELKIKNIGKPFFYNGFLFFIKKQNHRICISVIEGVPSYGKKLLELGLTNEVFYHDNWKEAMKESRDNAIEMFIYEKGQRKERKY